MHLTAFSVVIACLLLAGCGDYTVMKTTATSTLASNGLPPVGFDHQYGDDPLSSRDGLLLERQFFAHGFFWEVRLDITPARVGDFSLGTPAVVKAARDGVSSLALTVATEQPSLIGGLLADRTVADQEKYSIGLLNLVRSLGYRRILSAAVYVYFTEADQHAKLTWSASGGYHFTIEDDNLKHEQLESAYLNQTPPPVLTLAELMK